MNLLKRLILAFIILWPLLGTAEPEVPRTYLLAAPLPANPQVFKSTDKTLLVSIPQAAPGFDTPALVYMRTPYLLEYYSKSQWIDTPARLFLPLLVYRLEASGLFRAVLSAVSSPIASELRLETEIMRLQQEFFTEPSQVRLVLRVQLLDMQARTVMATQVFEILEKAPSDNAEGAILAANRAFSQVLTQLLTFLGQQLQE